MASIFQLPSELIAGILIRLDINSLLRCGEACKILNAITQTQEIQYIILLARSGFEQISNESSISPADALQLLRSYNERWDTLTPIADYSIFLSEPSYAYELVDGIFAKAMPIVATWDIRSPSRMLTLYTLPTAHSNGRWSKRTFKDLGCDIKDFAIDPAQDLLVLLESYNGGIPNIKMHFRTMSMNRPHPLAHTGCGNGADIVHDFPSSLMGAEMQILDDLIALHTFTDLFIWNWHTGILHVYIQNDPRSMTEFDFLSRRYFMVTSSSLAQIYLYDLHEIVQCPPGDTPVPKVVLSFPPYFLGAEDKRIWSHTAPFVTRRDKDCVRPYPGSGSDALPFKTTDKSRIHVLTVELVLDRRHDPVYFFVTIMNSWLLECIRRHGQGDGTAYLSWNDWGKEHSHWHRTERMHAWLRFIHGGRFIHPSRPNVNDTTTRGHIIVTDFSRLPTPPIPGADTVYSASGSSAEIGKPSSTSPVDDAAWGDAELYHDLDIPLPYSELEIRGKGSPSRSEEMLWEEGSKITRLKPRNLLSAKTFTLSKYTGFMIDDHRILAFRTEGDGLTSFDVLCFI